MPILEGSVRPEPQVAVVEETEVAAPSLSLRDFFAVLRRRKAIAINTFVVVVALGVVLTLMTKPVYRATARIQVEGGNNNRLSISTESNSPIAALFREQNNPDVPTQVEIIQSPDIIDRAVKASQTRSGIVAVAATRVETTEIIQLIGTSNNQNAATQFIKRLPEVYRDKRMDDRQREVRAALNFAKRSLGTEASKLKKTEAKLAAYNKEHNITDVPKDIEDAMASNASIKVSLDKARTDVAGYQALLGVLVAQKQAMPGSTVNPVETTNPDILTLKNQIAEQESARRELLFKYKETDDTVRQVDLKIQDLRERLRRTPATVTTTTRSPNVAFADLERKIADARSSLASAQATLQTLEGAAEAQNRSLRNFTGYQLEVSGLKRDQLQSTASVSTLSDVVQQLTLRQKALEAQGSPVAIIQPGSPAVKIAPSLSRNLIMSILLGALLACAAALLQDSLDDHVRDEDEARRLMSSPVLGYFPQLPANRQRPLLDLASPDRVALENFRALRTNVQFTLVSSPGRLLQVTSSLPSEGKSYVASNLAIAMALDGRKVVLVDADLHRPRVHEIFDVGRQPGLTNILLGEVGLKDALIESGVPGLQILSSGALPPNPVELLNSPAMNAVFEELQEECDIVIFDSPPMLAAADGQVLSSKVDGVLYVMQLGRVPRSALQRSMELLHQANANVIGTVFNKVDEKQHQDSYGGYGNYYYGLDEGGTAETAPSLTGVLGRNTAAELGENPGDGANGSNGKNTSRKSD